MSDQSSVAVQDIAAINELGSSKVDEHHLNRSAVVYVRQSSARQLIENTESTARQYGLVNRAVQLGWPGTRVEVIDEDQARSGSTAEGRLGFQRLLSEVGLDHVGIILAIEMNRLARSNKDWHQLIELCAIFRTLLADQDGVYDPTDYNDRLLLGLRGMMSEAELHILRGRMHEALLNKARRGDLFVLPPTGYVKLPTGEFGLEPDEQAQNVIRLVFDTFDRHGSMRRVLRYLHQNDIKLPVRPHKGSNKGMLEWRRATRELVCTVLTHPLYAGTYRYGHRQTDPRRKKPGHRETGRVVVSPDQYHALIPDHCPAYITRERYERNLEKIKDNRIRPDTKGPTRNGQALLGGLLFCGRCQRRMAVHYNGCTKTLRYVCQTGKDDCEAVTCQSLSGRVLDDLVTEKIMIALEPAALELSLQATEDLEDERRQLDKNWQQRLERARYHVDRAKRQYQAAEPENRLVARELERQWESALRDLQTLEEQYARHRQTDNEMLTEDERNLIRTLSENLPRLWNASTTTHSDRQRIVRLLTEKVVINIQGLTDRVDVSLHWTGGFTSQHELVRPVLRYEQMAEYKQMVERIEELRGKGATFSKIAEHLNREGFRPAQQAEKFHKDIVSRIFRKLRKERPTTKEIASAETLEKNEWFAISLAEELQMPKNTLLGWVRRGWVHVRRQLPGRRGRKICWADESELNRLRQLRATKRSWWDPPLPVELTTPSVPRCNDSARQGPNA